MKTVIRAIFLVIFIALNRPVIAHEGDTCDEHFYEQSLGTIRIFLEQAEAATTNGNLDEALAAVQSIRQFSAAMQPYCMGLVFRSEKDGLNPAIGPVQFPNGIYIARVITNGAFTLEVTPVAGECVGQGALFHLETAEAMPPNGAEAVFKATECSAHLQITAREPWLLRFELVSSGL
jgi:hypothetical protein